MRILVADDNHLVRRGIIGLLSAEPAFEVCGEVADGNQVLPMATELRPDLVLLDVSMPGTSGMQACQLLRGHFPRMKIIIMSQHDPNHLRPRALEAGANACLDKARISSDLLPSIELLFRS